MTDEQDRPVLNGAEPAPADLRLRGILEQVRADTALHPDEDREALLRTRLSDAGIPLSEEEMRRLIAEAEAAPGNDAAPGVEGELPGE